MEPVICKKCGSVDDYNTRKVWHHLGAYCNNCEAHIKWLPQGKPPICFIGKYKGVRFDAITDIEWLRWVLDNVPLLEKNAALFRQRIDELAL